MTEVNCHDIIRAQLYTFTLACECVFMSCGARYYYYFFFLLFFIIILSSFWNVDDRKRHYKYLYTFISHCEMVVCFWFLPSFIRTLNAHIQMWNERKREKKNMSEIQWKTRIFFFLYFSMIFEKKTVDILINSFSYR